MWPIKKRKPQGTETLALAPGKMIEPSEKHIVVPLEVIAVLAACSTENFDNMVLIASGLRACCEKQDFDLPQGIIDALVRMNRTMFNVHSIIRIIVDENGGEKQKGELQ